MSISRYYKEKEKLFSEQRAEREVLLAHGLSPAEIDKLHAEDYEVWKADRRYYLHNSVSTEQFSEEMLSLISERLKRNDNYEASSSFLDDISDKKLLRALLTLKPGDLEMVEVCLIDGFPQKECAARIGKTQSAVSKKLARIKAKLAAAKKNKSEPDSAPELVPTVAQQE